MRNAKIGASGLSPAEGELIARAKAGDTAAYERLVSRYRNLVFGVAYHELRNFEDARDAAQDAFLQAWLHLGQLRDNDSFGPWLRRIVINECRIRQRRQRPESRFDERQIATEDEIRRADTRLVVARALGILDAPSRLTITLFYLQSYSMREIAAFLEEPITTIKSRLRNARAKLRKELGDMVENNLEREALSDAFADRVISMIEAARTGDEDTLKALLHNDPGLASARDSKRSTPLHAAAGAGNTAAIDLLLAYGAMVGARDEGDNATPLHYAAERGHLAAVERLVAAGADVNANDDLHERGPLGWATVFSPVQTEVADFLIARGARYDIFSAIALDRPGAVRAVISADNAAPNARMSEFEHFRSATVFAMSKRRLAIAELLVELGAHVGLDEAVALGHLQTLNALLDGSKGDLDALLRLAVACNQVGAARLLIERGASPDAVDDGRNTLFEAIGSGSADLARLLIRHGANLEFRDAAWNSTPLGWAVFFANVEAAELAITLGAAVDPALLDLAASGERGELRSWSSGTADQFRRVAELLASSVDIG